MESTFVELTGIGKSHLNKEEISTNDLKDNEAIVKAEYSLISAGTELSRAFALKKGFSYPVRPGYSLVGRIVEKGKDIQAEKGDPVFVNAPHASLVRWDDTDRVQGHQIIRLPDDIDLKEATALNLLLVALQGVNLLNTRAGMNTGVFGLGNIGIFTGLICKKMGMKAIGLDPVTKRCELAEKMGFEYTIDSQDQKEQINRITEGRGLDIAIDVTGLSPVIMNCADSARAYGQVLLLGSPRQAYETDITPFLSNIHMKDLKVIGAFNKTVPVHPVDGSDDSMENNIRIALDLIRNRDIEIEKMIDRVIDPKDCEEAYYDLMYRKDQCSGVVFDWRNY